MRSLLTELVLEIACGDALWCVLAHDFSLQGRLLRYLHAYGTLWATGRSLGTAPYVICVTRRT